MNEEIKRLVAAQIVEGMNLGPKTNVTQKRSPPSHGEETPGSDEYNDSIKKMVAQQIIENMHKQNSMQQNQKEQYYKKGPRQDLLGMDKPFNSHQMLNQFNSQQAYKGVNFQRQ